MRGFLLLMLLAAVSPLQAQDRELRLDVSGEIAIDHQGAVYDYRIHTILTPEVRQIVDRSVRRWTFEPVVRDGKPVHAKSGMHLTLMAIPVDAGYQLRIEQVLFVGNRGAEKMAAPQYPREQLRAGLGAAVLVAVRVDAEGNVTDAVAVQSAVTGARRRDRSSEPFEKASVAAMKQWRFRPADLAAGEPAEATLVVPMVYAVGARPRAPAGWHDAGTDLSRPIPWLSADKQQFDANGLKEGQTLALDNPVTLTTSVVGTTL